MNVGDVLQDLKSLNILTLSSVNEDSLWLSPGDQHNLVHRLFQQSTRTLRMIVFNPWMAWHMDTSSLRIGECHCELELLRPKEIRRRLLERAHAGFSLRAPMRDWNGKLAGVFSGAEDVQGILQALIIDSCS